MQELPTRADDGALERRKSGELTALEVATRRRNRRWMGFVLFPSLIIGAVALIAALVAGSGGSSIRPTQVPPGYRAVSQDGYFAYAVPSAWSESSAYTDDTGDLDTQGQTGWAAEHVDARATPPTPGENPPSTFATFGESQNVPYRIGPAAATTVSGASVAYRYTVTRSGGFQATAVDAWQSRTGAEIWLLVHADAATTSTILASLNG